MNEKMLALRERIKLNAEYTKYFRLINHKNVEQRHLTRFNKLKEKLTSPNTGKFFVPFNKLHISPNFMRHYHIAYSMLKGREYSQIEVKVKEQNILNHDDWTYINKIIKAVNEEDVCTSQE